jgi:hypothetical protein
LADQASGVDDRRGITPGSIAGLKVEALADAREYTALAALAQTANDTGALGALAAASSESEAAFRWMWTIASSGPQPQRWEQVRRDLGEGIRVPENLQDAVTQFVLAPVPEQPQQVRQHPQRAQPPDPRREVQALLLGRLDPAPPFARDLARSVLEQELGRLPQGVRQAAFEVLGTSGVAADRKLVFEHTEDLLPRDRLGPLTALTVPYSDVEVEQITDVLKEALPVGQSPARSYPGDPPPQTYWEQARELTARLPAEDLHELLQEPWTRTSSQLANLLDGTFVRQIGLRKLKALLTSDLGEPVSKQLLEVSSQALPPEELAEFGRFSHEQLSPELSSSIRSRLSSYARPALRRGSPRSEVAENALAALRDFTLLCDDWETARAYASSLQTAELGNAARDAVELEAPTRRLGRVARVLLERDAQTFQDDVSDAADVFAEDSLKAAFLSGVLEAEEGAGESAEGPAGRRQPGQSLPAPEPPGFTFLGSAVLGYRQSIGVLAEAGYGRAIVDAAKQADAPVRECLLVAEAALGDLDDSTLEELMKELHWATMDLEDYGRYVAALSQRSVALLEETEKALDSLAGPEADVIAPDKLVLLLRAALDAGAEVEDDAVDLGTIMHRSTEHLQRLFGTASRSLHDLAREWAEQLTPGEDLVGIIVRTDAGTVGAEEEFGRVRRTLAGKLVSETQSPAKDWQSRGDCLELAREADPELARQAALTLGGTGPADFRRRVAKVLADTDAREADEETLRRLAEDEPEARVRDQLTAALHNITSGSVGRAAQNLRSLVGLDSDEGPDLDVLLPYEDWHETFVANVDKARRRAGGDPDAYISSLVMLTEFMVEQAVIARFEAKPDNGSAKEREVEALRRNHSSKPGIGALLERQRAQSVFPWFNEAIVLRRLRNAHHSPTGTTRPLVLGDDEVVEANALFRRIVLGWEISMRDSV